MKKLLTIFICLFHFSYLLQAQVNDPGKCHFAWRDQNSSLKPNEEESLFRAPVERSDTIDILDYDLYIDLRQYNLVVLYGIAEITFKPKINNNHVLNLDLLKLTVDSVFQPDGTLLNYNYTSPLLSVNYPEQFKVDSVYKIIIKYHGRPTTSSSGFGGFYFEDGIAYNLGIGLTDDPHNYGRSWFPCFDNFVERSTYTYRVQTIKSWKAVCSGSFVSESIAPDSSKLTVYRMNQQIPTYLSSIAASDYIAYDYTHISTYDTLPVQLVAKSVNMDNVKESMKNLPQAIDAIENWYGPYPFERVGYVMTTRGAMEHPNNIAYPVFVTDNGEESRRLYSHELTHLWWGDLTTLKTQADMWIKEGNAEYGSHLFTEFLDGRKAFESLLQENNYQVITSAHTVDGSYLPLSPMPKSITYGSTTYYKGAMILHCVRGYLGDSLFESGQRKVLQQYAYQNLTAQTYRDALTQHTGVDMTDFFDRWIFDRGFYDFHVTDFEALDFSPYTHRITIRQKLFHSSGYCKDAPVTVTFVDAENNLFQQRLICNGETSIFDFNLPINATAAFINTPWTLNLAHFSQVYKINAIGGQSFPYGDMTLNVNTFLDTTYFIAEHHLSAPDRPLRNDANFRISNGHFWHVAIADTNNISINSRVEYSLKYESDLMQTSEDSIQLFYRPNDKIEWSVYLFGRKIPGSLTDKRGAVNLRKLLPGDYAFGNIDPALVANKTVSDPISLNIYPNPASDKIQFDIPTELQGQELSIKIYDFKGKELIRKSVNQTSSMIQFNLPGNIPDGNYVVTILDRNQNLVAQSKIAVLK